jgi:hypothetical protein
MNAWTERRRSDDEIDALLSGRGTTTTLVDVAPLIDELRGHYADRPVPTPNAELEQVFAWGLRAEDDDDRAPAVAWLPARARARASMWTPGRRVAVALLAATIALGGLAVAGAVPAVQDAIADAAKVIGLDLPRSSPDAPSSPSVTTTPARTAAGISGVAPVPAARSVPGATSAASSSSTTPTGSTATTTLPTGGNGEPAIDVPPLTVPTVDIPPITVPDLPIDVPPIGLPPIDPPPITVPPVTLPPLPPIL